MGTLLEPRAVEHVLSTTADIIETDAVTVRLYRPEPGPYGLDGGEDAYPENPAWEGPGELVEDPVIGYGVDSNAQDALLYLGPDVDVRDGDKVVIGDGRAWLARAPGVARLGGATHKVVKLATYHGREPDAEPGP